jgi:putative ABC transport system permease protein
LLAQQLPVNTLMTHILRDARLGTRLLRRHPGFTAIALLTLALGVGANTAIFSVVYATLLAPLPYENPDSLVLVWSRIQGFRNVTAAGDYLEWKRLNRSFDELHAWSSRGVSLSSDGRPERVQSRIVTPGFLTAHGFKMHMGRDFLPEEGIVAKDQAIVITHQFWQTRFGGDAAILNRQVRVDGKPHTVVGVLAPGVADRLESRLFVPLAFTPDQVNHDFHWLSVLGRLKPGVTMTQANADMADVTKRLAEMYPSTNTGWAASVEPLKNNFLDRNTIAGLWMLLGAVGFVLLIACANVANLLLARGTVRQREVAVRSSLGASRGTLIRQLLTESVVLAGAGGVLGLVLAYWLMDGILALLPPNTLPSEADVRLNVPVLVFTFSISLFSGLLSGCAPAWHVTRLNLNDVLKEAGRSAGGAGRQWMRRAFVVTQFALALTLLAGAGLAIASLVKLTTVDLGFRTDHLLTFSIPVPGDRLKGPEAIDAFYRQLLDKSRAIPGVTSVSISTGMPVLGTGFGMPFSIVGNPVKDPSQRPGAGFNMVTPDYYKTFGISIQRGRAFTDQDSAGAPKVAIVNDAFVRQFLKDVDPLKQRLVIEQLIPGVTRLGPAVEWQIVGVYPAVRNRGPRGDFPEIDVPFAQSPWPGTGMAVRTTVDPDSVRKSVAAIVQSLDPDLPIADVKTMDQLVHESLAGDRWHAVLFGGFGAVALVLAALGIYGVMSFVVAQRSHEIGLRMALGASRLQVLRQILGEGVTTALIGVALGSIGAYFVGRAMQGMLFGVGALDPAPFSIVAGLLLGSAVLACFIPARRAASMDPMTALRQE